MSKKTKIILIGINHAGTTAIKSLVRNNPNAEVIAYDRNDNISFLGCGIALWISKEFDDSKGLFYSSPEKLSAMGVKIRMNHEMISLDVKKKSLEIKDLKTNKIFVETYDKLILAIGSWPILSPGNKEIPGLLQLKDGQPVIDQLNGYKLTNGIYLSKLYQHAQEIIENLDNPSIKNIVVVGGGYIGVELVEAFIKLKKNVTLIDLKDRVMSNYYDSEFTNDLELSMKKNGVKLQLGECVEEFIVANNHVSQVVTDKNKYKADLVIMSIGFKPNTAVLKNSDGSTQVKLNEQGAIIVNQYFQTSNPDVYAIGDCIAIHSNASAKDSYIALATNAVRSGLVAGLNITTNNKVPFPGIQGTNAICVFDWKLAATGLSENVAKLILGKDNVESICYQDSVFPPFMKKNHQVKIKIIWEKKSRVIIGAQIASIYDHTEIIFMFSLAIMKKLLIDELALVDMYFLPHCNKPYNYVTSAALLATGVLNQDDVIYPWTTSINK